MYISEDNRVEGNALSNDSEQAVIGRFEAWLRSHGYEPRRDPFIPPGADDDLSTSAVELVGEYLDDRPGECHNREALTLYALEIGDVSAFWGDSGCSEVHPGAERRASSLHD